MDEQELVPLLQHELDLAPPEVKELFYDLLKYRVDPAGDYYGMDLTALTEKIQMLDNKTIHAIDSEFRYAEKGKMFDPILQSFTMGCGGQITNWSKSEQSERHQLLRFVPR